MAGFNIKLKGELLLKTNRLYKCFVPKVRCNVGPVGRVAAESRAKP